MKSSWIWIACLALVAAPMLSAAEATAGEGKPSVDEIIRAFVENETQFAKAREQYTYRQEVKLTEYKPGVP